MKLEYQKYLCSREWCEKKEQVKERSHGICERCLLQQSDHVHHLTYARQYHEHLDDLQDVCEDCHRFIHAKSDFDPRILPPGGSTIILTETLRDTIALREVFPWVYRHDDRFNLFAITSIFCILDVEGRFAGWFNEAKCSIVMCPSSLSSLFNMGEVMLE